MKDIEQILDDYAIKHGYKDWQEMFYDHGVEIGTHGIEDIAKRFAQQYIDANKDLRSECLRLIEAANSAVTMRSILESGIERRESRIEELVEMLIESKKLIGTLRRSMSVHPDCTEGSEFDDYTTSAQDLEDDIDELISKHKQP